MKYLFDIASKKCSKIITNHYSTSFSLGIKTLDKSIQSHIYNIYGFVRFADEIVDSFQDYKNNELLYKFKEDTFESIKDKISLNPILNSFQYTVNEYKIDVSLIYSFFDSMELDLKKKKYNNNTYKNYIYGSAEVVGLMCLKIFVNGNQHLFNDLKDSAKNLGSAFQKVNFLRDLSADSKLLGRVYFPEIDIQNFNDEEKNKIEDDISLDFNNAIYGIKRLPKSSRGGVYLAYKYYLHLFKKIKSSSSEDILNKRIRINNLFKLYLLLMTKFRNKLQLI